ncbi:hypothetical protein MP228_001052 [Amoeboaphelidium protococcarum]|nr:hypothetical protein MP228_001052 [Amoeboaphelidium protococcarum]
MPTRRAREEVEAVEAQNAVGQVSPAKKGRKAAASHGSSPAAKKQKAEAQPQSPEKKQKKTPAKKDAREAGAAPEYKEQFGSVMSEIDQFGNKIQRQVLAAPVPAIVKKQDPVKSAKRKAIVSEVRRISSVDLLDVNDMDVEGGAQEILKPQVVKQRVKAEKSKKKEVVNKKKKAVVGEIDQLGDEGVRKLLHPIKSKNKAAARGKAGKKQKTATKSVAQKVKKVIVDTKELATQTFNELTEIVSPSAHHRPSAVKSKLDSKKLKKQVEAEMLKATTVREIKVLGQDGIKQVIPNHVEVKYSDAMQVDSTPSKKAKGGKKQRGM